MTLDTKPLLVVTGTRREGALVAGPGVTMLAGGGDGRRLAQDLARLTPTACGIISFGTGGGLLNGQGIGDLIIGSSVTGGASGACDLAWLQALSASLPQARVGPVFADGTLLGTATQKRQAAATGAIVADMESHLAAAAARQYNLPFAILRCISDTADTVLPPAVAVAMQPDGGLALGAILTSILRQPAQLPALIRVGGGFGQAFTVLRQTAHVAIENMRYTITKSTDGAMHGQSI